MFRAHSNLCDAIFAAWRSTAMSSRTCARAANRCTLTTTSRPSWVRAAWIWATEAAAIGSGVKLANSSSGSAPSSVRMTRRTCSNGMGEAWAWREARVRVTLSDSRS